MTNSTPEIVNLSNQLAQAVEAALNPGVPQEKRLEAYNACEEFKEKSPLSVACSVYLSSASCGSHLVRHFGLQLMEYCVKYKWYEIDQSQKISIKDVTMSLLESCEGDIAQHTHLRDALSRVIVEMMKREWPQHWPNLLPELYQIAAKGWIQGEIVLLVFLRFVEDVVVLQTLEYAQRRRDLYQQLMLQMEQVFTFILNLMAQHYKSNVPESVRVINLALNLLSEIVEFAFVNRIAAEETRLVPVLCNLLTDERFQLETAECLNRIASKKGKHEDRRTVCKLLLNSILLNSISQLNLMLQNGTLTERNYLFIKKVAELLASLCSLLCAVVKSENDNPYDYMKPETFVVYLDILVNLCKHSSLVVAHSVNTCWTALFKHSVLKKDTHLLSCVTKWVSAIIPKLVKIPYEPHHVLPVFEDWYRYLVFDFDAEGAFNAFYYKFRTELSEAFRHLTAIAPQVVFGCVEQWLGTLAQKSAQLPNTLYPPHSEEYLEWEAISTILEVIIMSLPKSPAIPFERGTRLLDVCFSLKPADPNIRSFLLSCISPLMYFVHIAPSEVASIYAMRLLERLFEEVVYELPGETSFNRSKSVKTLRRHAICLLLKLSRRYPAMFLPYCDHISGAFNGMKREPNRLSKMEVVLFLETIIQINNSCGNFERQSLFVKQIFAEVKEYWMKLSDILADRGKFASFIGLDVKPSEFHLSFKNRTELMYCVDLIGAVVKSCTWPESKEAALIGGFARPTHNPSTDLVILRNPATPHILPALPGIFSLVKVMHCLWTDEAKAKLPAEYEKLHDISEHELKQLFGDHLPRKEMDVYDVSSGTENVQRMQAFLINLYETCFAVLAKSCHNLGYDLYELPNFAPSFGASMFCNLDSVPDYRLRGLVKTFIKPFIFNCPADKYDVLLVPILNYFANYMYQRLAVKWKYLQECRENGKYNEDESEQDNKELVEHYLNTQLSREYMDIVKAMLLKTNTAEAKTNGVASSNEESRSPVGSQTNLHVSANAYDTLSELGLKLLRCDSSRNSIVNFILDSISWTDSTNSLKATFKIPAIVKQLLCDGNMTSDMSVQIVVRLLQGLQVHGQHDANQGALLQAAVLSYQLLRPSQPQLLEILTMVPAINMDDLQKFDQKVLTVQAVPYKEDKGMKDMFRKLVNNLIGRNIGQLFKRKETIRDLPKIEIPRPKGENILNTSGSENDFGIANFFS